MHGTTQLRGEDCVELRRSRLDETKHFSDRASGQQCARGGWKILWLFQSVRAELLSHSASLWMEWVAGEGVFEEVFTQLQVEKERCCEGNCCTLELEARATFTKEETSHARSDGHRCVERLL